MTPRQMRDVSLFGLFYALVVFSFWFLIQPSCVFAGDQLLSCPLPPYSAALLLSSVGVAFVSSVGLVYWCLKERRKKGESVQ